MFYNDCVRIKTFVVIAPSERRCFWKETGPFLRSRNNDKDAVGLETTRDGRWFFITVPGRVGARAWRRDRSTSTQEIGCVRGANSGRPCTDRSIGPRQSVRAAVSYRSPLRQQTTWSNLFSTAAVPERRARSIRSASSCSNKTNDLRPI